MSTTASSSSNASNIAKPVQAVKLSTVEGFICGGIAASGAVLFSNPMEVRRRQKDTCVSLPDDPNVLAYRSQKRGCSWMEN